MTDQKEDIEVALWISPSSACKAGNDPAPARPPHRNRLPLQQSSEDPNSNRSPTCSSRIASQQVYPTP